MIVHEILEILQCSLSKRETGLMAAFKHRVNLMTNDKIKCTKQYKYIEINQ